MSKLLRRPYDLSDSPTLQHFITDFETGYCGIMSHVNSGKTTAMVMKSQLIAANQHPDGNGVRATSHLLIRGTHGDLLRGIVRTFEKQIDQKLINNGRGLRKSPPVGGKLNMMPLGDQNQHFPKKMFYNGKAHPYKLGGWDPEKEDYLPGAEDVSGVRIGDVFAKGTFVDALFDFVPLDNPDWEAMLLGTEYTAAYFDEPDSMSNIAEVLTKLPQRLGRFPPAENCPITATQVNMAYNPPRRDSFTQKFFDPTHPEYGPGRKLYRVQPPFLMVRDKAEPNNFFKAEFKRNPDAEGIRYAPKGWRHWEEIIDANRHDGNKIRRDVLGEYTHGSGGDLIHTEFNRDRHVLPSIKPERKLKLFVSCDWGNAGAALFAQVQSGGVRVIEELGADGQMAHEFVRHVVIPHINTEYRGYDIIITGDPSGAYKRDVGEGPFKLFEEAGFLVESDNSNDPEDRWSAVNYLLKFQDGLQISQECEMLIKGFEGEYVFKKQKDGTQIRQTDKRKPHSAYQDCLQAIAQLVHGGYEYAATGVYGTARDVYDEQYEEDDILWV